MPLFPVTIIAVFPFEWKPLIDGTSFSNGHFHQPWSTSAKPRGHLTTGFVPRIFFVKTLYTYLRGKNIIISTRNLMKNKTVVPVCYINFINGLLAIYKSTATEECRFHSNTLGFTVYRLKPWNLITEPATILQHITIVPAICLFPWNGCQTVKDKAWNRMGPAFVSEELNVFKGTNSSYVWR